MKETKHCIVCGSLKSKYLFTTIDRMFDIPGSFDVKKCKTCGLGFVDPTPDKDTLQLHYPDKDYYSYKIDTQEDLFGRLRTYLLKHYYNPTIPSKIFSVLVRNVPALPSKKKNGKILDVGCGTGDTLLLLQQLGWDVYGLEIDKQAIAMAKKRGLKNVALGSYEDIKRYPDDYFDVIRLYHVIEHLPNPNLSVELIYKKLKPGGEIILGTPNTRSVTASIFGKFWYNLDVPRHIFLFSPQTLSKIMQEKGFSQIQVAFCSAGGLHGSIIYFLSQISKTKINPGNFVWLFFLLYPFEWLFDKFQMGDIMILAALKEK